MSRPVTGAGPADGVAVLAVRARSAMPRNILDGRSGQVCASQIGAGEVRAVKLGVTQVGVAQVGVDESSVAQIGRRSGRGRRICRPSECDDADGSYGSGDEQFTQCGLELSLERLMISHILNHGDAFIQVTDPLS